MNRIQDVCELECENNCIICTRHQLKLGINFNSEYRQQPMVLLAVPVSITKRNHRYFPIKLQLLQISENIVYTLHFFKIIVIIRSTARFSFLKANILLHHTFDFYRF